MAALVFITGATSGIGKASAELFAANSYNLVICGRRKERLAELQKQLSEKVKVHTLCFDLSSRKETEVAINNLPEAFKQIDIL